MTTTIDNRTTYLQEGTIDASNKHLFSPGIQAAYEFFEVYGFDTPINPIKHGEGVRWAMRHVWQPKIVEMKKTNSELVFKDVVVAMLADLEQPEYWSDDNVIDLVLWAKKVWQAA